MYHSRGKPYYKENSTVATEFRSAGFKTGYVGKWHLSSERDPTLSRRKSDATLTGMGVSIVHEDYRAL